MQQVVVGPFVLAPLVQRQPEAFAALERLAHCGAAFRALAGLSWELPNLESDWAHACAPDVQVYMTELDDALERLGWGKQ